MTTTATTTSTNPNDFLDSCEIIDVDHPNIQAMARQLAQQGVASQPQGGAFSEHSWNTTTIIIQRCFEFVRDEIQHSMDQTPIDDALPVTCKASDVLRHGTGFCYAKSHLLAALLRANNIPCGLCYQRLTMRDDDDDASDGGPFCLHGLNAVYLSSRKDANPSYWYRLDPRGLNNNTQHAQFCPPHERLAYPIRQRGERDIPGVYRQPRPDIVRVLTTARTWQQVVETLPDADEDVFEAKK